MMCHTAAVAAQIGGGFVYAYGGTVYQADGITPAPNVEIGVRSGLVTYSTYSGTDGNFWMVGDPNAIVWAGVQVRVRNANGEKIKASTDASEADCNSCHNASPTSEATPLKAP